MTPHWVETLAPLLPYIGILVAVVFAYALIRLAVKDGMKDAWKDQRKP